MKQNRSERKQYVKEQRKKLKESPEKFLKENVIQPFIKKWKEEPIHATWTFLKSALIMYLVIGSLQAINYDMTYCDATINEYDGKVMYVHNEFVKYYNQKAQELMETQSPMNYGQENQLAEQFNQQYSMYCTINLTRWNKEPIQKRIKTTLYALKKITLKQS